MNRQTAFGAWNGFPPLTLYQTRTELFPLSHADMMQNIRRVKQLDGKGAWKLCADAGHRSATSGLRPENLDDLNDEHGGATV